VWLVCCEPVLSLPAAFQPAEGVAARHVDLEPVAPSVGIARSFVSKSLVDIDQDDHDIAVLLTSELVTNAVLHARTPVQVSVLPGDGAVLVCVGDRLAGSPALTPRPPSGERPGGRGLALVNDLSDSWGSTAYPEGKTVWFVLRTSPDRARSR
jgi:anti-sigma regulatory factor (Ser/Thr protein kinase)